MNRTLQITKCSDSLFWYKGCVGDQYKIFRDNPLEGYVWVRDKDGFSNMVLRSDFTYVDSSVEITGEDILDDIPSFFPDESKNLTLLVEECSEVIQAVTKIQRFGIDDVHPKTGKSNREELTQELGDLLLKINILVANGTVSESEALSATYKKALKLTKWY